MADAAVVVAVAAAVAADTGSVLSDRFGCSCMWSCAFIGYTLGTERVLRYNLCKCVAPAALATEAAARVGLARRKITCVQLGCRVPVCIFFRYIQICILYIIRTVCSIYSACAVFIASLGIEYTI